MEDGALTPKIRNFARRQRTWDQQVPHFPLSLGDSVPPRLAVALSDILTPSVEGCAQMRYEIVLHRSNWKTRQKFKEHSWKRANGVPHNGID
jgi:hypothetical protein